MSGDQRTVVLLEDPERGGLRVMLLGRPSGQPGPSRAIKLDGLPRQVDSADAVERYGRELLDALRTQKDLSDALDDALKATGDDVRPLCFKVQGPRAEQLALCWEMLWEKKAQFLALNPRWPVVRIADSNKDTSRVFRPPLRIMAVMSALGEEARPEWLGLHEAVLAAREGGLPVHLTVVVGEQLLLDELREVAATEPGTLKVVALRARETITELLRDAPPHLLHFYCHGYVGNGEGQLELATIGDRAEPEGEARSSVEITISELETLVASRDLWLVTLNCCSGAKDAGDVQSIAQSIVAAGAGAALGWREPVDARDANLLCRTLYRELLGQLARQLTTAPVESTVQLELAASSFGTRRSLRSTHDGDPLRWTLPVLYLAPRPLSVFVVASQPAAAVDEAAAREVDAAVIRAAARASTLDAATRSIPGAPATVMEALGARIAAAQAGMRVESGDGGRG